MTIYILPLLFFMSCMPTDQMKKEAGIVYEVFIQSFRDSNGDGIGDLPGIISKLDYIQDLGATAIWITPFHPSPSYHKYDVADYYQVHPDYGTMEDMEQLISEVHRRDMKIIMDLVINHTSDQHPWFVQSSSSATNTYRDYYVWKNYEEVRDEINKKETTFDSDNLTQWHLSGDGVTSYYGFFWKGMPDLNFDNPAVREEVYKIGKFWLDKGIDGFRLDAAKHIYPDDQLDDTRMFWEEFTNRMRIVAPEVMIFGEVWADATTLSTLFKGLPSLFNFELSKAIPDAILSGDPEKFFTVYQNIIAAYDAAGVEYQDAILISNHDMNRIRSTLGGSLEKTKLAAAVLLTLPGTPFIYYGEEIGMLGQKPDELNREPFLWGDGNFQEKSWMNPVYSKPPDVRDLIQQEHDPSSIYHHYKTWMYLRKHHPSIAFGKIEKMTPHVDGILQYKITGATEKLAVIHNFRQDTIEFNLPEGAKILSHGTFPGDEDKVKLGGYSSVLVWMSGNQ